MATTLNKAKKKDIKPPKELLCPMCDELINTASLAQCCGNSYCDECIRGKLLKELDEDGEFECKSGVPRIIKHTTFLLLFLFPSPPPISF